MSEYKRKCQCLVDCSGKKVLVCMREEHHPGHCTCVSHAWALFRIPLDTSPKVGDHIWKKVIADG